MFGNIPVQTDVRRFGTLSDIDVLPTEPVPKPRRAKGMTYKKLYERIRQGYGMGHGSGYKPWLTLRRKNPSPRSNQVVSWMPPLGRTAHYFSRGEYHTALLLLWLGVKDLREQFPIWPIPHPHPLVGTPGAASLNLPWSRGLLTIADECGINHGYEIGSRQPYVASLDLVATAPLTEGPVLAVFSSKPISEPTEEVKWRTLERLELERRYSLDIGATYFVSSSALIPLLTAGQLEWWLDCATLHCAPHLSPYVEGFAEQINTHMELPINETVIRAGESVSLPIDDAWLLFRYCAWTQIIDIDPSVRILTSYPIRPGGRQLQHALRRRLFGESWP
ncbi:PDDEXK family nuclease [Collimonas humicola]|uniref:TnsA endonuclease N-terminal domain-containing protein n=1 Tax=Collimonas humicola TaxID=2825886 RepID=UPI001B8C5852|nr:TnsA endonuclease N-terminal domain-containing protein [Collimonas humicola]